MTFIANKIRKITNKARIGPLVREQTDIVPVNTDTDMSHVCDICSAPKHHRIATLICRQNICFMCRENAELQTVKERGTVSSSSSLLPQSDLPLGRHAAGKRFQRYDTPGMTRFGSMVSMRSRKDSHVQSSMGKIPTERTESLQPHN